MQAAEPDWVPPRTMPSKKAVPIRRPNRPVHQQDELATVADIEAAVKNMGDCHQTRVTRVGTAHNYTWAPPRTSFFCYGSTYNWGCTRAIGHAIGPPQLPPQCDAFAEAMTKTCEAVTKTREAVTKTREEARLQKNHANALFFDRAPIAYDTLITMVSVGVVHTPNPRTHLTPARDP
jgi:hypothetical protein